MDSPLFQMLLDRMHETDIAKMRATATITCADGQVGHVWNVNAVSIEVKVDGENELREIDVRNVKVVDNGLGLSEST